MELVKALTKTLNSITVCATIHSPSHQTFSLFDKVIILLRGRIVYFGDNGAFPSFSCPCMSVHLLMVMHAQQPTVMHHPCI